ncbi:MAG: Nif3-like dinuclear metal center hexameric protein, partial [Bacteroidota bacterium]
MILKELITYLEASVPPAYQESYDNSGLQVGDENSTVDSALLSLDITEEIVDEAEQRKCGLVISHHPLIFQPLKCIGTGSYVERIIRKAIQKDISLYSMHTNLDIISGGVSYRMAEKLGLTNTEVMLPLGGRLLKLVVFVPLSHAGKVRQAIFDAGAGHIGNYDMCSFNVRGEGTFRGGTGSDPFTGEPGKEHTEDEVRIESVLPAHLRSSVLRAMIDSHPYEEVAYDLYAIENRLPGAGLGCVGDLAESVTENNLISMLSDVFGSACIRHSKPRGKKIKRVAVMGGSGGSYIDKAISAGAQAYVTADVKYHSFFDADKQILLADIGHYESEKPS